mgnify:CR=1 FL=1
MSPRFENQLRARPSVGLSIEDALAALLAKDPEQSRDEPEIATAIGAQLEHMELNSMPTSLLRRIRDIIARVQPKRVCEVGSGIGHMSAWLFDYWSSNTPPEHFDMVEAGGKFGVILTKCVVFEKTDKKLKVKNRNEKINLFMILKIELSNGFSKLKHVFEMK